MKSITKHSRGGGAGEGPGVLLVGVVAPEEGGGPRLSGSGGVIPGPPQPFHLARRWKLLLPPKGAQPLPTLPPLRARARARVRVGGGEGARCAYVCTVTPPSTTATSF